MKPSTAWGVLLLCAAPFVGAAYGLAVKNNLQAHGSVLENLNPVQPSLAGQEGGNEEPPVFIPPEDDDDEYEPPDHRDHHDHDRPPHHDKPPQDNPPSSPPPSGSNPPLVNTYVPCCSERPVIHRQKRINPYDGCEYWTTIDAQGRIQYFEPTKPRGPKIIYDQ